MPQYLSGVTLGESGKDEVDLISVGPGLALSSGVLTGSGLSVLSATGIDLTVAGSGALLTATGGPFLITGMWLVTTEADTISDAAVGQIGWTDPFDDYGSEPFPTTADVAQALIDTNVAVLVPAGEVLKWAIESGSEATADAAVGAFIVTGYQL